jgi:beta-lactamase regulating signal transducer with metallopeptidase domain/HEAT repeat protein
MIPASLLMLTAKATVILVAALGMTFTMQRASAGARHLVWLVTLGTLLLVPALAAWSPLRLAILPAADAVSPPTVAHAPSATIMVSPTAAESTVPRNVAPTDGLVTNGNQIGTTSGVFARFQNMTGSSALLALWAAIVLVIAAWLGFGALTVRRIVRRARPLDSEAWLAPLWDVSDRLSLDEPPRLLQSEDAKMPFACGIIHPTIVLPAECDNWTPDRRLAVLLHELAHVRRHDLIGHTLGRVTCAVYWFHPLVWTAAKQLRSESERACDDLALVCGARASDYAEHLLDIVTSVRHDSTPAVALAMARRKEFEGRMLAILDPELRHSSPSRWQSAGLVASLAVIAIVVGAAAPAQRVGRSATVSELQNQAKQAVTPPAAPRTRHAPAYPDSGVPGVSSMAEWMTKTENQVTQTRTNFQIVDSKSMVENQYPLDNKSKGNDRWSWDDKAIDASTNNAARAVERIVEHRGGAPVAQTKADDRPILLANVLRTDTSASLRRIAAWGLSEYADTQVAAEALANALVRDHDAGVREMAAWALGHSDEGSRVVVEALSAALHGDSDEKVRATAAWALGDIGDSGATDALVAALSEANAGIRMRAIWGLGQISPKQAPRALVAMLQDRDMQVREVTAWALYEIADPAVVPALNAALQAETDKNLQIAYIRALAATGEKSVDALRGLLESKDTRIRSMAVRALAGGNAAGPWPWPWPQPRPFP